MHKTLYLNGLDLSGTFDIFIENMAIRSSSRIAILFVAYVSVFAVSGEVDILLEIIAEDMQHFSDVILKDIFDTEGVNATRSSFVLEEVKSLN